MSPAAPVWEPAGNAVHRLIQYLDVLAIALQQYWMGLTWQLPDPRSPEYTPATVAEVHRKFLADFTAVHTRMFSNDLITRDFIPQTLADAAVAAFVRLGRREAEQLVREAQKWLEAASYDAPVSAGRQTGDGWQKGLEKLGEWVDTLMRLRTDLINALVLTGNEVPPFIYLRLARMTLQVPATVDHLIQLIDEAQLSERQLEPPAPLPNGSPQGDREKSAVNPSTGDQVAAGRESPDAADGDNTTANPEDRMNAMLEEDESRFWWTLRQWEETLGVGKTTVGNWQTWTGRVKDYRLLSKAKPIVEQMSGSRMPSGGKKRKKRDG